MNPPNAKDINSQLDFFSEHWNTTEDAEISDFFSEHWVAMPSFTMNPEVPFRTVKISFKTQANIDEFSKLIGQNVFSGTENYWFPKLNRNAFSDKVYIDEP